jgi:tetratricopeptide (TPR) repeat protein
MKMGNALYHSGRYEESLEWYSKVVTLDPHNYGAYVGIGNFYRDRGDFATAQAWYERAARTGNIEWPYLASSRAFEMQGDYAAARSRLEAVLQVNPSSCEAHGRLGILLWRQGDFPYAIQSLRRAVSLCPELHWGYQALGDALRDAGLMVEAVQAYETALQHMPGNMYVEQQLSTIQQQLELH